MRVEKSNISIVNCTVTENIGGGYWEDNHNRVNAAIENSIFWNNGGTDEADQISGFNLLFVTVDFSDVQGTWTGGGSNNIDEDPAFVDAASGNYRLTLVSPCIDAGDETLVPADGRQGRGRRARESIPRAVGRHSHGSGPDQ